MCDVVVLNRQIIWDPFQNTLFGVATRVETVLNGVLDYGIWQPKTGKLKLSFFYTLPKIDLTYISYGKVDFLYPLGDSFNYPLVSHDSCVNLTVVRLN